MMITRSQLIRESPNFIIRKQTFQRSSFIAFTLHLMEKQVIPVLMARF